MPCQGRRFIARVALLFALSAASSGAAQSVPSNGLEVLQRMHDAYIGKWYHTLTFVQKTTAYRDTAATVTTWYESLRHTEQLGTQLRIDIGNPSFGNGMLYTADSSWRMRDGKLASHNARGNEFLPVIEGVYVQPVAETVRQMGVFGVDMSHVMRGVWQNRPAWIVGAQSPTDTTSSQFWTDIERNVVVRLLMNSGSAASPPTDVHLDGYVKLGAGWLATKVVMSSGGKPRQIEEYSDFKADMPLLAGLFDPLTWTTTLHWVEKRP